MEAAGATQSYGKHSRPSRAEFDGYSNDVLMNEREAAQVCGFSTLTLKHWRLTGSGKGPAAIKVYGSVRYRAGARSGNGCAQRPWRRKHSKTPRPVASGRGIDASDHQTTFTF
jgi:hypothetical protein